jgi:hypothetical protein
MKTIDDICALVEQFLADETCAAHAVSIYFQRDSQKHEPGKLPPLFQSNRTDMMLSIQVLQFNDDLVKRLYGELKSRFPQKKWKRRFVDGIEGIETC